MEQNVLYQLVTFADRILVACALRFDGYKYHPDPDIWKATQDFFESGEWNISLYEKLAIFFLLQRALYKWALEYEPLNSRYYRAFHSLFLEVYAAEIPEAYRMDEYYSRWEKDFKPHLAEYKEVVMLLHSSIEYDDNAKPMQSISLESVIRKDKINEIESLMKRVEQSRIVFPE